jgi:sigma-54 dependent transcriptional regulator, acetoin dehydrogenase operon transcriptional activator AcoR
MSTLNPYFYAHNAEHLAYENAWVRFLKEGVLPDNKVLRDEVKASWLRCKALGIDPLFEEKLPLLSKEELAVRVEANKDLLALVTPFLNTLFATVEESGFRVDFLDKEGYILKSLSNDYLDKQNQHTNSFEGANRSETVAGTNAIGLSIITKNPIQISGAEHYIQQFHRWSYSAAPILSPKGEILGVIGMAGHYEQAHKHTLALVTAVAKAVENALEVQEVNDKLQISNSQLQTIFGGVSDGIVYVVAGKVIEVNEEMCSYLGVKSTDLIGTMVTESIHTNPSLARILSSARLDHKIREIVLEGDGRIAKCLIDVKNTYDKGEEDTGEILIFTRVEEVQMMAKQIVHSAHYTFADIIGNSSALRATVEMAQKAGMFNSRVLLEGESGTGKEILAQAIHNFSGRKYNSFVAVDCGAIPKELFESELFGYESGAFTGAKPGGKLGLLELADKGTLFLDEIGNMPMEMQKKLLRVLQEGTISRIGSTEKIDVDIRVIAATNMDLQKAVDSGDFRKDLFYRLNVFHIMMPSLRERIEDIPLLTSHFINKYLPGRRNVWVDDNAMAALKQYDWPGNIRELNNVIERALIMCSGNVISPKDLPLEIQETHNLMYNSEFNGLSMKDAMKKYLDRVLADNNGNISKAAKVLDVSRSTIYRITEGKEE